MVNAYQQMKGRNAPTYSALRELLASRLNVEHINETPVPIRRVTLNNWPDCRRCYLCDRPIEVRHLVWCFSWFTKAKWCWGGSVRHRGAVHDDCARNLILESGESNAGQSVTDWHGKIRCQGG